MFNSKLLVYQRVDGEKDPKKDHQRPFLRPVEDLWGVKRCEKPLAASMPVRTANPFPPGTRLSGDFCSAVNVRNFG